MFRVLIPSAIVLSSCSMLLADVVSVLVTIRDFQISHPDFENGIGTDQGFVADTIGTDRKPVYIGGAGTLTTSGEESFNQWYNDTPGVNLPTVQGIVLNNGMDDSGGVYTFCDATFFPIDGALFGNEGLSHNYHFTLELHAVFTHQPGLTFAFLGDDDLFVFINDQLVIDLGGVHDAQSASVNLDSLGLTAGNTYAFDLFFAERHTTESQFCINTTIVLKQPPAVDLAVQDVETVGLSGDWQTLKAQGTVSATVVNSLGGSVDPPFQVTFFEDRNFNRRFEPGVDNVLGTSTVPGLAASESIPVEIEFSSNVLFRGNIIYASADSGDDIPESNELNNLSDSGTSCAQEPVVGAFVPELKWSWTSSTTPGYENWLNVLGTPTIVDLDGDSIPEVIFSSGATTSGDSVQPGVLRVLSGLDGHELWTVTDPSYRTNFVANTAAADLDGDGVPEIIAVSANHSERLICFEHDGTPKRSWLGLAGIPGYSDPLPASLLFGGVAISDLDGDGTPEIIAGRSALRNDGSIMWAATQGGVGSTPGWGAPLSYAADLDLDGFPEVVAGNTVYRGQDGPGWFAGEIKYLNNALTDGLTAVGNFDSDSEAEIVFVANGSIWLLEHDLTPKTGWPYIIPGGGQGGAPTIADFDGDGAPEIGVAARTQYVVVKADGTELWKAPIQDSSSHITGSSVFDFEGDGAAEVVYRDELYLRVFRGFDGTVLFEYPISSCTAYEYPLVADLDDDSHAEIVAVANTNCGFGTQQGVYAFGSPDWVPTRRIWNQHAYHITNVNDDGSVPAVESPHWLYPVGHPYNSFRQNILTDHAPLASSDLTASFIRFSCATEPRYATVRIGNGGALAAPAGVPISFYDGDPQEKGTLLETVLTSFLLPPGVFQDVSIQLPTSYNCSDLLYAVVDDAGELVSTIEECNEGNNFHWAAVENDLNQFLDPTIDVRMEYADTTYNRHQQALLVDGQARNIGGLPLDAPVMQVIEAMTDAGASPGNPDGYTAAGKAYFVYTNPFDDPAILLPGEASPVKTIYFNTTCAHVFFEEGFQAAENHAPFFISFPVTAAIPGAAYNYLAAAIDPNGQELTFGLAVHPTGMRINATTGALSWMPSVDELGSHAVIVTATDTRGGSATQQFNVVVGVAPDNSPPAFLSVPNLLAQIAVPYEYVAFAFDPEGSAVTYSLDSPPAGMVIDGQSGALTWTPPASSTVTIIVLATDSEGAVGSQQYDLFVPPPNVAPTIVSTAPVLVMAGGSYYYNVDATDANGDVLTHSLLSAPGGMSINPANGLIVWPTGQADVGTHDVIVQVSDPYGAAVTQEFQVMVLPDQTPPQVNIVATPNPAFIDEPVHICVNAGDNVSIAERTLMINSVPQTLTTGGCVDHTSAQVATLVLLATATDGAGNLGSAMMDLSVVNPNDPDVPTIEIISPAPLTTITAPTEIIASIRDSSPATLVWEVRLSRGESTDYTVISQGQGEVVNGTVAFFDPSLLPNDNYRLTFFASDGVHNFTLPIPYGVSGDYKLGNFSISFTDLTIPIAGIPLVVTRQYDSLDTSPGDFGLGWRLGLPGRVRDAAAETPNFEPLGVGQKVYVTRPDGRRVGFKVQAIPSNPLFQFIVNVFFQPDPGVTDELALANPELVVEAGGFLFTGLFDSPYNPSTYIFTTREKVKYTIDEQAGLQQIEDIFGNTITVTPDGLISSLPEGCTTNCIALSFVRDAVGRITQIIEPDDPNEPDPPGSLHYDYNPTTGNLIAFRDQMDHATQYFYENAQFQHYLTRIQDPLNDPVVQNLFDADGRLIGQCNAMGDLGGVPADPCADPDSVPENCSTFCLNPVSGLQTVINARGFRTDLLLDERGNIIERRKFSADGTYMLVTQSRYWTTPDGELTDWLNTESLQTRIQVGQPVGTLPPRLTMTYDERGNVLTRTEHGDEDRTWTYGYWPDCDKVATELDPMNNLTQYEYDADCNLRFVIDALGGVTEFQYNDRGQRSHFIDAVVWNGSHPNVWQFHYDESGLPSGVTDPLGNSSETKLNLVGELKYQIDRRGWRIDFEYDDQHRVTQEIWRPNLDATDPGDLDHDRITEYGYNDAGLLTSAVDPDSALSIAYWPTGLVKWVDNVGTPAAPRVRVTYGHWAGPALQPGYDPNGNVTHVMDEWGESTPAPQGMTEYKYDEFDRLASTLQYSVGGQVNDKRVEMEYYDTDLLQWQRRYSDLAATQNVANTFYDYDCYSCPRRVKEITHQRADGTAIHQLTFARDAVGNVLTMTDAQGLHNYSYDGLGRLLTADHPSSGIQQDEFYTYDAVGNRLSSHLSADHRYSYQVGLGGNRLLSDDHFQYTYDMVGSLATQTNRADVGSILTMSHDHDNRLVSIASANRTSEPANTYQCTYDAFGRRITTSDNGATKFRIYEATNPILVANGDFIVSARRLYTRFIDQLLCEQAEAQTRWALTDQVGSIRQYIGDNASEIAGYAYDSYGIIVLNTRPSVLSELKFQGRGYLASLPFADFRTRWYDPRLGRFTESDPRAPWGYNHAHSNPLRYVDPTGEISIVDFAIDAWIVYSTIETLLWFANCYEGREVETPFLARFVLGKRLPRSARYGADGPFLCILGAIFEFAPGPLDDIF